jgi:hypothetical protein
LVTCGPFRLATHVPNQTVVLAREPNFWLPGMPHLDNAAIDGDPIERRLLRHADAGARGGVDRLERLGGMEIFEDPKRALLESIGLLPVHPERRRSGNFEQGALFHEVDQVVVHGSGLNVQPL